MSEMNVGCCLPAAPPPPEMSDIGIHNHYPHIWKNETRKDYAIQCSIKGRGYVFSGSPTNPPSLSRDVRVIIYSTNNINEILGRNLRLTACIASKLGIPNEYQVTPNIQPVNPFDSKRPDVEDFTDIQKTELETGFKKNLTEIKKTLEQDRQSIRKAILAVKDHYGQQLDGVQQDLDRIINLINEQEGKDDLSNLEKQIKPLLDLEQKSKKGINTKLDDLSRQLTLLSDRIDNYKPKEKDYSGDLEEIKSLLKNQPKPEKQKDYCQDFITLQELIKANKSDNKQQFDAIIEKLNEIKAFY